MSEFFLLDQGLTADCSGNTYVTVAGKIIAPHGVGLRRTASVFQNNSMVSPLAVVESTEPLGSFSTTVNGLPTTEFTVISKGTNGENDVVYSHCKE